MCGFVQYTNDTFNWTRYRGSTPSHSTGPHYDHTTGNGRNVFFVVVVVVTLVIVTLFSGLRNPRSLNLIDFSRAPQRSRFFHLDSDCVRNRRLLKIHNN